MTRFKRLLALPLFIFSAASWADENAPEKSSTLVQSRDRRAQAHYLVLGNYSPIDLLIPNKYGLSIGMIKDAEKTWEMEYLRGSISVPFLIEDLGSMTDQRISIIGRSFGNRNTFNISYGLTYFDFSLHLGDQLLNKISGGGYPSLDLVEIQALGFNIGLGNRWTYDRNLTLSVDWVSWAQPVFIINRDSAFLSYATDPNDRDDVDSAIKFISYFPRFVFFKVQFGIQF